MNFTKPPTTTSEQVRLLAERGMTIADVQGAERFLDYCSYYRFRGYGLYFENADSAGRKTQTYPKGTRFEDVVAAYHFDARVRRAVFHYASIIEIFFRNLIGNFPAVFYGDAHWYLDPALFKNGDKHADFLEKCKEATRKHKDDAPVQNYRQKYSSPALPPIWILTECLSFADWSRLFGNLSDRSVVAEIEGRCGIPAHLLLSWLHTMTVVRNACAHHSRLWDRQFSAAPKITRRMRGKILPGGEKRIAAVFLVMEELLKPVNRCGDFCREFKALLGECDSHQLSEMGFSQGVDAFFA